MEGCDSLRLCHLSHSVGSSMPHFSYGEEDLIFQFVQLLTCHQDGAATSKLLTCRTVNQKLVRHYLVEPRPIIGGTEGKRFP